jgi:tetratricopeptide (TPR) repeat protein
LIMSRWVLALFLTIAAPAFADDLKNQRPQPAPSTKEEVPKEEDTGLAEKEYAFNPLQAEKEIQVGDFYFKKGKFRAAAERFREATKWNSGNTEAWLRLGDAAEKQKDPKAAKEAYAKFLDLSPDAKNAPEIRRKLEKLK